MLLFDHISHHYTDQCLFVDFSLPIPESRVLITGPNGSGKTSLLMLAAGLILPSAGNVIFNGQSVREAELKRHIGISASKVALPDFFNVKEFLAFHCNQFNCEVDEQLIAQFGLIPFLTTRVSDLSLGNYKKLSLVSALAHQPDLLLLDEPTNGLDKAARLALSTLLADYTGQVIIASHEALDDTSYFERHINLTNAKKMSP